MITREMTVEGKSALETRWIAMLVQTASKYECSIIIAADEDKRVNAKSIMGMMSLGLIPKEKIAITADGKDEAEAIEELENFVCNKHA